MTLNRQYIILNILLIIFYSMPGIYNEQKIYDALSNSSKEKGDESSIFDTEYSRKYYLESISTQDLKDAITKLERDDYAGVSLRSEMIATMKKALAVKAGTAVKTTDLKIKTGPVIASPVSTPTQTPVTGAVVAKPAISTAIPEDASLKANRESFRTMIYTVDGKSATFK